MKIALLNSVALNGGDAAIVFGTCDAIRQYIPDAEISVFCHSARHARGYYPDLAIRPMLQDEWPGISTMDKILRRSFVARDSLGLLGRREKDFYLAIRDADAIVYVGGGYLTDHYQTRNLLWMMARTVGFGVPNMVYAQSFGPFNKESTMKGVKAVVGAFDAVTTRDQASLDLLNSLGLPRAKLHFTADAAFAMRPYTAEEVPVTDRRAADEMARFKEQGAANKMLFVSVREWKFPNRPDGPLLQDRWRSEMKIFLGKLFTETDWKVCFLSTCQGRPEYNFDDSETAAALMQDLPDRLRDRVLVTSHPFHPRSYPAVIERCADLVVTMRMHMAVLSIMAGVPFIALAYEQKSQELARQVGLEGYCFDLATFDGDTLFRAFVRAVGSIDALRALLSKALPELRERSLENAKILAGILESRNSS